MSKRLLTLFVGAVLVQGVPAPAALADSGPGGQSGLQGDPIPHCEIWWDEPLYDSDIVPVFRTPVLHCT